MANQYNPASLGIQAPSGGFQQGGWYEGRQFWGGTLSDPGVIHPLSDQNGAGQAVSEEVNRQSAAAQNVSYDQFSSYLQELRNKQQQRQVQPQTTQPTQSFNPTSALPSNADVPRSMAAPTIAESPVLNLPDLYKTLYDESGISSVEADLAAKERAFTEAKGKINDNPYLSEATRVGRVAKLEELHADRTANLRSQIETKKADIQMRLDLESKQFDINSESAQLALQQFNTLLGMGALDNASGEDIANITRSTGLSSNMIMSAVEAQKQSNLQIMTETFDDGVNEGFTIYAIDPQGNVVNSTQEITGKSSKGSASGRYSEDPFVSSFIDQILGSDLSPEIDTGIETLWGYPNMSMEDPAVLAARRRN